MYLLKNTVKNVKLQKNSNLQENCETVIFLNLFYILVFYLAPHLPVLIRQEFIKSRNGSLKRAYTFTYLQYNSKYTLYLRFCL